MADSSEVEGFFSPGPWWGFNGVLRLAVVDGCLVITPVGGWKAGRQSELRVPLLKVEVLSRRTRRGLFGRPEVVVSKLQIDGKARTFTSKNPADGCVLDALSR